MWSVAAEGLEGGGSTDGAVFGRDGGGCIGMAHGGDFQLAAEIVGRERGGYADGAFPAGKNVEIVVGEKVVDSVEREEHGAGEDVGAKRNVVATFSRSDVDRELRYGVVPEFLLAGIGHVGIGAVALHGEIRCENHVAAFVVGKQIAYIVGEYLHRSERGGGVGEMLLPYGGAVEAHRAEGYYTFGRGTPVGYHVDVERVAENHGGDEYVVVGLTGVVLLGLPAAIVVAAGPGGHGPAVVVLPYECSHAVGHVAAVGLDGCLDGVALEHGAYVEECGKVGGSTELIVHVLLDEVVGVGAGALMAHHHVGCDMPVALLRSVDFHRFKLGERLEAVFGEEAGFLYVVVTDGVAAVPYAPVVGVAVAAVGRGVLECEGGGGPVGYPAAVFLDYLGEDPEIHILELAGGKFLDAFLLIIVVFAPPAVVHVLTLVVAAPEGDGTVVAQSLHVVDGLLADIGQEYGVGGVGGAGEHEVLPDEHAVSVAEFVEIVVLVDAASPYANHVHVDGLGVEHMLLVAFGGDTRKEIVERYHIDAFCKDGLAVEFEIEAVAVGVGLVDQLERAQADFGVGGFHAVAVDVECGGEIIEVGLAQTIAPPQARFRYLAWHFDTVDALLQSGFLRCEELAVGADRDGGVGYGLVGLHFDEGRKRCGAGVDVALYVLHVGDALAAPGLELDRAPDAGSYQTRPPVPAIVVAGLAGEHAEGLMEDSAVLALVGTGVESVVVFVEFGKVDLDWRVEVDFEQIVAFPENTLYVDAPCAVHIVGAEYAVVVEIDVGIGVETEEEELLIGLCDLVGGGAEIGLVHPVFLVDPLH